MDFGEALQKLRDGLLVARTGWNGRGMHLFLHHPGDDEPSTLPYIVMFTAQGERVPWLASQSDLLATDWTIV